MIEEPDRPVHIIEYAIAAKPMATNDEALHDLPAKLFKAHPWHAARAWRIRARSRERVHRDVRPMR